MIKAKYLVSACLAGSKCRYDGKSNYNKRVATLVKEGFGLLICPEVMGGLSIPRVCCEQQGKRVINKDGLDKTLEFEKGAKKVLKYARQKGITKAILKTNSPSCGIEQVYDGSFSRKLIAGQGVCAKLLAANGFELYSEKTKPYYDVVIVAAGSGRRAELGYNKMFYHSGYMTVIESAVEPFVSDYLCNQVIVVCQPEERVFFTSLLPFEKVKYADGGASREESVYNGVKLVKSPNVLIHDGARAYLTEKLVGRLLKELQKGRSCIVPYLIKTDDQKDYVSEGKAIQTPQAFKTGKLLKVLEKAKDNLANYRDESSIVKAYSRMKINYIIGEESNLKLTDKEDLVKWAEWQREEERKSED